MSDKKQVTVSEETHHWLKIEAARQKKTIEELVEFYLEDKIKRIKKRLSEG